VYEVMHLHITPQVCVCVYEVMHLRITPHVCVCVQ